MVLGLKKFELHCFRPIPSCICSSYFLSRGRLSLSFVTVTRSKPLQESVVWWETSLSTIRMHSNDVMSFGCVGSVSLCMRMLQQNRLKSSFLPQAAVLLIKASSCSRWSVFGVEWRMKCLVALLTTDCSFLLGCHIPSSYVPWIFCTILTRYQDSS